MHIKLSLFLRVFFSLRFNTHFSLLPGLARKMGKSLGCFGFFFLHSQLVARLHIAFPLRARFALHLKLKNS